MTRKKSKVFLLGAGAAIPWGGPPTDCLTKIVCQSGFKNSSGKFVTQAIFEHLENKCKIPKNEINFETILNVIEDFIDFWSHVGQRNINGLSFFVSPDDDLWSTFIDCQKKTNLNSSTYALDIPSAGKYNLARLKNIPESEPYKKKYFQALIEEVLDAIFMRIFDYTDEKALSAGETSDESQLAIRYFKSIESSYLRFYSLNYDRVIQFLLKKAAIPFIEGVVGDDANPKINSVIGSFSPRMILDKTEQNCVYHLHGSIFWEIQTEDLNGLPYYNYFLNLHPQPPSVNGFSEIEMEKGRATQISNIISGYRKTIRTALSPFRQMISAFDRDCYQCDELIIVGYSFGDEHINDIINKARNRNDAMRVEIVVPSINMVEYLTDHVSKWGFFSDQPATPLAGNIHQFPEDNVFIYQMKFEEYLKHKIS